MARRFLEIARFIRKQHGQNSISKIVCSRIQLFWKRDGVGRLNPTDQQFLNDLVHGVRILPRPKGVPAKPTLQSKTRLYEGPIFPGFRASLPCLPQFPRAKTDQMSRALRDEITEIDRFGVRGILVMS